MAASLIEHELIKTTLPKAKELRRVAEPLITMAKEDSVSSVVWPSPVCVATLPKRRQAVQRAGPRYKERAGGYLRIRSAATVPETRRRWRSSSWWTARRSRPTVEGRHPPRLKKPASPGFFGLCPPHGPG